MTDARFLELLRRQAYDDQITGYPVGHPGRINFRPIVPTISNPDGTINRARTLELPCFSSRFTEAQRAEMCSAV